MTPFLGKLLQGAMRLCLSLLLSKPGQPRHFSCSSQDIPSSPFASFVALLWKHPRTFTSFSDGVSRAARSAQNDTEAMLSQVGTIPSPDQLFLLGVMHARMRFPSGNTMAQRMSQLPCSFSYPPDHMEALQATCVKPADSQNQQIIKTVLKILPKVENLNILIGH